MVKYIGVIKMALDGLFLHFLIDEIKDSVEGKKIYKIIPINDTNYLFVLSSKTNLLINASPGNSHIRLTNKDYMPSNSILAVYLKKHIEGGIINSIKQYKNDRVVLFNIFSKDELGYKKEYNIILELMGKNSNLIICDENLIVLEAIKKSYLTDEHLVKTGIKYKFINDNKINPFDIKDNEYYDFSQIQGLSKQAINELNTTSLQEFLSRKIIPTLIQSNKNVFYYTDLYTLEGNKTYFNSLSELLEHYYDKIQNTLNENQDLLNTKKYLEKELDKLNNKLEKQLIELEKAKDISTLEKEANLLMANIYQIKPYQTKIDVYDYENNNELITLSLNPNLSASENVNAYFNKIKKNKRTVVNLSKTIEQTKKDIEYYQESLTYLDYSKLGDLKEIMIEFGLRKAPVKNQKPRISRYIDEDGNTYFFGKNNAQNNYLTHTLASKDDYFFHVKNIPGSHVILRGELNDKTIKIASNIASLYSKAANSIHVCVDYTQVKWVKKVPGEKGSFVTYTHEKMYFSDPNMDELNAICKLVN